MYTGCPEKVVPFVEILLGILRTIKLEGVFFQTPCIPCRQKIVTLDQSKWLELRMRL